MLERPITNPTMKRRPFQTRLDHAKDLLRSLGTKSEEEIGTLVIDEAGPDLAAFLVEYSRQLMEAFPERPVDAAGTLVLLGYWVGRNAYDLPAAVNQLSDKKARA